MIITIIYKTTQNSRLFFNAIIYNFFGFFCPRILTFLFAIVYCSINNYQDSRKIIIFFDRKTVQSLYFFMNYNWSDVMNDRYIYTDNQIVICLFAKTKKVDYIQVASNTYLKYKKKRYPKTNRASVWSL